MIAYLIVIAVALIGGGILFIFKNKKDTLPIDENLLITAKGNTS